MRTLYFVTSNPNKYKEVAEILKPHGIQVEWANIKLKEIQSNDIDEIARDKVLKAFRRMMAPVMVEHDGLILEDFGQIPGGLTQVFWDALGAQGFCRIFSRDKETAAVAQAVIAYCDSRKVELFRGSAKGKIVTEPRDYEDFQWDCVFQPDEYEETYSQLGEIKKEISMRRKALNEFAEYLKREKCIHS